MIITGLRATSADRGSVRVEEVFDTDPSDLWQACTDPERLARWIAVVAGDLTVGGRIEARFTSGWEGVGTIETCKPPRRLVVRTRETGEDDDHVVEATLTAEGERTRLVIEEHDVPIGQLHEYGAGWQIHVEDLVAHLAGRPRCDLAARWNELIPEMRRVPVSTR